MGPEITIYSLFGGLLFGSLLTSCLSIYGEFNLSTKLSFGTLLFLRKFCIVIAEVLYLAVELFSSL